MSPEELLGLGITSDSTFFDSDSDDDDEEITGNGNG